MAVAERQRTARPVRTGNPSSRPTTGGGGGNGLESWKGFGDDDGSYSGNQSKLTSLRGAFTGVIDDFSKTVADPFKKQLIGSATASKAQTYASTKAPQYVENAKKFYAAAAVASNSDVQIKSEQINFAKHHSVNLVKQQGLDHQFARQQMQNVVAQRTDAWVTAEEYLAARGALDEMASQTQTL